MRGPRGEAERDEAIQERRKQGWIASAAPRPRNDGAASPSARNDGGARGAGWERPTHGDIRYGFVYERVPHITLKSIANNSEIDVIWEHWQETLEPFREKLNAALGRSEP